MRACKAVSFEIFHSKGCVSQVRYRKTVAESPRASDQNHEIIPRPEAYLMYSNTRCDPFAMQDEWDVSQTFGNYTQTLTNPRRMEFAGIYRF